MRYKFKKGRKTNVNKEPVANIYRDMDRIMIN